MGCFLCIANTCNAKCVYCFASQGNYGKAKNLMQGSAACKAIDFYMKLVPEDYIAYIIYFGGEPLLAYNEIKESVEYTVRKYEKVRKYKFHIVTNASLLTKEMIDYFSLYNFSVSVSIDGGKEIQNYQRPLINGKDSFYESTKNISYLFDKILNVNARGTYYNFNTSLVKAYDDLLSMGFSEISIPPDILDIQDRREIYKLLHQLDDLYFYILNYINKNDSFPFTLFSTRMRQLFTPKTDINYSCGVGNSVFAIDTCGDIFPCHRFQDRNMIMGNIHMNIPEEISVWQSRQALKCSSCWNRFTCSHGCAYDDYRLVGSLKKKNEYWCIYSKKMTELCLMLSARLSEQQIIKILKLNVNCEC